MKAKATLRYGVWWLALCACLVLCEQESVAADFAATYSRGKLLLRQKLYKDALRMFHKAITQTRAGRRHFGAHFYTVVSLYRLGDLSLAMAWLKRAKGLATTATHRSSLSQIEQRIQALFGRVVFRAKASAASTGRLMLKIQAISTFHHEDKVGVYSRLQKRLLRQGHRPKRTLYLPKGKFRLSLASPQCRRFRLQASGQNKAGAAGVEVEIDTATVTVLVMAKPGCPCPQGTRWSASAKSCLSQTSGSKPSKAPVGLIVALTSVAVLGGAAAAVYFLAIAPNTQRTPSRIGGKMW